MSEKRNTRNLTARAEHWQIGTSGTGKHRVEVLFGTSEGELTWYGYFTEATMDRTIESLRHCGWEGDDLEHMEGLDANEVVLVVAEEEYEGKWYTKVQWVNRQGITSEALGEKELRAFAAEMKSHIRAFDAANGKRQPAKPEKKKKKEEEDDLAF